VGNKERKIKRRADKEFQNFEGLIRNSNFFEGLIRNLPLLILGRLTRASLM
jgi:hypothetical protein